MPWNNKTCIYTTTFAYATPTMTTNPQKSLFRPNAVAAATGRFAGTIVLAQPMRARVAACTAGALSVATGLLMTFGQYTHRAQVTGQLEPAAGIVKVVAPNSGRVTRRFIEDGNLVTAGQPLYELSAERGSGSGATDLRIDGALAVRHEERKHTLLLQIDELRRSAQTLEKRQRSSETELITRQQEIALQNRQVRNASNKLIRYAQLSKQDLFHARSSMT